MNREMSEVVAQTNMRILQLIHEHNLPIDPQVLLIRFERYEDDLD